MGAHAGAGTNAVRGMFGPADGPFFATQTAGLFHLVWREAEREAEFLVSIRGAALKFAVPAVHPIPIHSRCTEHLDPKLDVNDGGAIAGSYLAEHPGQEPLLVFETDDVFSGLAQALFQQPGSGLAAGG